MPLSYVIRKDDVVLAIATPLTANIGWGLYPYSTEYGSVEENLLLEHRILMRYFVMITPRYITTWKKRLGLRLTPLLSSNLNAGKMEEELGMP